MNKLLSWQTKNKISNRKLSELVRSRGVRCHESMVSHYHAERRMFSPAVALAIVSVTRGVSLEDIFLHAQAHK